MATATAAASTLNWDTVFAVSIDELNADIVTRNKTPTRLQGAPAGPLSFSLNADFDPWMIVPGGDGGVVNFGLPMRNLVANYVLQGAAGQVTCADAFATIGIRLNIEQHTGPALLADGTPLPAAAAGTTRHALKPRTVSAVLADPVATLIGVDFRQPLSDPQASPPIETAILNWCTANLSQFQHIFAFIDLNDQVDTGPWAFCKPIVSSYAYVDLPGKSSGILGLLCMTSALPAPTAQQVSALSVPAGSGAAFLIGEGRLLEGMIKPSLLAMWPNLKDTDLDLDISNAILRLKSGVVVGLPQISDANGTSYDPMLTGFVVQILGNEMKIETHTDVEVSPGIHATCFSTNWFAITLGKNAKGEQTLVCQASRPATKINGHYSDQGVAILTSALLAITICLATLALFVDGALSIVVDVALLVALVGTVTIKSIGQANQNVAPSLDGLTSNFIGPITWSSTSMKLNSCGLNGSLQLGGDFS